MLKKYRQWRANGHSPLIAALAAPPLGVVLGLGAAVGLIVGLGGCSKGSDPVTGQQAAQENLDDLVLACRDGVQYLVTPSYYGPSVVVVPRMKLDGTLYRCSIAEEPQRVVEQWEQGQ